MVLYHNNTTTNPLKSLPIYERGTPMLSQHLPWSYELVNIECREKALLLDVKRKWFWMEHNAANANLKWDCFEKTAVHLSFRCQGLRIIYARLKTNNYWVSGTHWGHKRQSGLQTMNEKTMGHQISTTERMDEQCSFFFNTKFGHPSFHVFFANLATWMWIEASNEFWLFAIISFPWCPLTLFLTKKYHSALIISNQLLR